MIFAAGLGTRLQPLTDNKPKALVELNGKTLLERCILNLQKNGITDIVVNVHHFADQVIDFVNQQLFEGVTIVISDERKELLDTGGGLLKAKALLGTEEDILIINVDVLTDLNFQKLAEFHQSQHALASMVVRQRKTSRYLRFNNDQQLCGWINEKTRQTKDSRPAELVEAKKYAFSGIHIISPKIFELIDENGKFSIIDLYLRLAKTHSILGYLDNDSNWMDLGKYEEMDQAIALTSKMDQRNSD